jgi:hypothetical protein
MILVSFMFVVTAFAVFFGTRAIDIQELDAARDTAMSELALAREHAMDGTSDSAWGVAFATSSITTFKGSSFAGREKIYDLTTSFSSKVRLSGISSIVFLPPDGSVLTTGTVNITNGVATSSVGVNAVGGIDVH